MIIYNSLEEFGEVKNAVVTTGTFDGVHLGHQKIISRLSALTNEINGETVLVTFYPHPRMVLFTEDNELKLLTTQTEKIELLEKYGVQHLIIHPFTKEFSRLTSLEFVRNYLVNKLKTKKLAIGYNHHFGRNREGSFEHLNQFGHLYNFEVEEISAQDIDHIEVSSTKIRNALLEGNIEIASSYLGYNFGLRGNVVEGKHNGKKIGYPTANIFVDDKYKLIPKDGVYVVRVKYANIVYGGMLNIGSNPTFGENEKTIEVNIFGFERDIYNEEIIIEFVTRMRNEIKFNGVDELKSQLAIDKTNAMKILKTFPFKRD